MPTVEPWQQKSIKKPEGMPDERYAPLYDAYMTEYRRYRNAATNFKRSKGFIAELRRRAICTRMCLEQGIDEWQKEWDSLMDVPIPVDQVFNALF